MIVTRSSRALGIRCIAVSLRVRSTDLRQFESIRMFFPVWVRRLCRVVRNGRPGMGLCGQMIDPAGEVQDVRSRLGRCAATGDVSVKMRPPMSRPTLCCDLFVMTRASADGTRSVNPSTGFSNRHLNSGVAKSPPDGSALSALARRPDHHFGPGPFPVGRSALRKIRPLEDRPEVRGVRRALRGRERVMRG